MLCKIIGMLIIIVSTAALGMCNAKRYANRINNLENLARCVAFVENEIRFSAPVLSDVFSKVSKTEKSVICDLFEETAMALAKSSGKPLSDIWKESVNNHTDKLFDKDVDLILSFAECLNRGDVEGQTKSLKQYGQRVNVILNEIKPFCDKNARLSKSFGIYSGLLISVLLF